MIDVQGVELFHWNPRRPVVRGRIGRLLPIRRPVNNFGDMLGPAVATALVPKEMTASTPSRLLSIGSVLHFAQDGDVVWGSGVNGKVTGELVGARRLDVRAVRGPLTARALSDRGIEAPNVFGDPGLLAPALFGVTRAARPTIEVTSLPNLHDLPYWRDAPGLLSPRRDFMTVMTTIASSQLVVTSSLHGIVIADALGVPVAPVRPTAESMFKYEDYYEGTGRRLPRFSETVGDASNGSAPGLEWNSDLLIDAFPRDLWRTIT